MAKTRGAQTPSPSARNTRPRTSTMRDSMSEAPQASAIPPSEGGMPPSPSQRRYETRRPPTTPEPQPPTTESQIPIVMTPEGIIRRPMVTQPPIEGNLDCQARPFHSELCFDRETFRHQLELRDSFHLLQRYHLEHLMTPRDFFYPE
ncbi:hypothetical protein CK203_063300 [Vitis vinifera]|uniref:Uncharacterized protein n=1 Tax=Vitis vinifera TaxID=29760 RepID=A0A438G4U9_VITVI|nr:hypothetical protein CK203_063300 [Vitis vinifera]